MNHNRRRIRLKDGSLVRRPPRPKIGTGIAPGTRLSTVEGRMYVVQKDGSWRRETPKEPKR